MHPSGKFVFDGSEDSYVNSWVIDPDTGNLTPAPGSPYDVSGDYVWLAATPDGKFLYGAGMDYFTGFAVDNVTGELTLLEGFPVHITTEEGEVGVKSFAITPNGKYLYAADFNNDAVAGFSIDGDTGELTLVSEEPLTTGKMPKSVTVDAKSRYVYVANYGSDDISIFSINDSTGVLTPVGTFATGAGPKFISVLQYYED